MGVLMARVGGGWQAVGSSSSDRWNNAWGTVAYSQNTTGQNGIGGTPTDLSGLSVTFTPVAGRRYVTTTSHMAQTNASGATTAVPLIRDGGGANLQQRNFVFLSGQYAFHPYLQVIETGLAAVPTTRKASLYITVGTIDVSASPLYPAFISVEDIGPVSGAVAIPNPTPAWVPLTFTGTWGNADTTNYNTAAYRSIGDIVYLRGYVKSTSTDLTVGVLPVGFRPPKIVPFTAYGQAAPSGSQAAFRCGVHFNGNIFVNWAAGLTVNSMTYLDLENVQFSVTP